MLCPMKLNSEQKIRLDVCDSPEFDSWRWIDYFEPQEQVIFFKRHVYKLALKELEPYLTTKRQENRRRFKRGQ